MSKYCKERTTRLVAQGLCGSCGVQPLRKGTKQCQGCADYHKKWRESYYAQGLCICGNSLLPEKRCCQICLNSSLERSRKRNTRLKDEVYSHYGGYKCNCCGETEKLFLTIDHINNDGNIHRKNDKTAIHLIRWLSKNNYPVGFQILCWNCQQGKRLNNGICPHKIGII